MYEIIVAMDEEGLIVERDYGSFSYRKYLKNKETKC